MSSEEIWSNVLNANEHFCKLFIENLAEIFLKSKDNITGLSEKRDNDTLVLLRIKLHSSLLEVFPDLFYYDLITRRKKALLIGDIYWISQSTVENKVTEKILIEAKLIVHEGLWHAFVWKTAFIRKV